jgi:hypothetical protein
MRPHHDQRGGGLLLIPAARILHFADGGGVILGRRRVGLSKSWGSIINVRWRLDGARKVLMYASAFSGPTWKPDQWCAAPPMRKGRYENLTFRV